MEQSLSSGLFLPAHVIDAQAERRIQQVLSSPPVIVSSHSEPIASPAVTHVTPPNVEAASADPDPFDGGFD